ncbi:MAG: cell division protein FtsA [Rickettsiaceae bacterium]|nr:cell division protein FtsA [Rickettsiaceae bacterium]
MSNKVANLIEIDIGSSKITALACNYIGKGEKFSILHSSILPSEGMVAGSIFDATKAEQSIASAIYAIENSCRREIKEAIISLPGVGVRSFYITYTIVIENKTVSNSAIQKLIKAAVESFDINNYEVIDVYPLEYIIDDVQKVQNPVNMVAKKLTANVHIVAVDSNNLANLTNCLAKYQIGAKKFIPSAIACGYSCLSKDERARGSIIIDFGAKSTSFCIFINSKPVYTSAIPLGGWHITNDIATVFSIDLDTAEKLKILYGYVNLNNSIVGESLVDLEEISPQGNIDGDHIISTATLAQIIKARIGEVLALVKLEYDRIGIDNLVNGKVVATGGCANIRNLKELMAMTFRKQSRIGLPEVTEDNKISGNLHNYSSALGSVKYYIVKLLENSHIQEPKLWRRIINWFFVETI